MACAIGEQSTSTTTVNAHPADRFLRDIDLRQPRPIAYLEDCSWILRAHRAGSIVDGASYWLKVNRAEQHIVEIKRLLIPYDMHRPYKIIHGLEGVPPRHVYRVSAEIEPDPIIAIVVGEFLFNLRSALDHMRAALVPRSRQRNGYFPIFTKDIWKLDPNTGEYVEATKHARERWISWTKGMSPEALATIDEIQPFRMPPENIDHLTLPLLNALHNADKHSELVAIVGNLKGILAQVTRSDGTVHSIDADAITGDPRAHNGAIVASEANEVAVEAYGAIGIAVSRGPERHYGLPETPEIMLAYVKAVLRTLEPFARL